MSAGRSRLKKLFKNYDFIHNSLTATETFLSDDPRASMKVTGQPMELGLSIDLSWLRIETMDF